MVNSVKPMDVVANNRLIVSRAHNVYELLLVRQSGYSYYTSTKLFLCSLQIIFL